MQYSIADTARKSAGVEKLYSAGAEEPTESVLERYASELEAGGRIRFPYNRKRVLELASLSDGLNVYVTAETPRTLREVFGKDARGKLNGRYYLLKLSSAKREKKTKPETNLAPEAAQQEIVSAGEPQHISGNTFEIPIVTRPKE